ncbi:MAG TPA: hypothetical protein VEC60_09680 [Reyranella sp.]|nr:hypothetical protein [Candidatus Binatia bacterium]HYD05987.1 hypothetical protein [Reyranella sp.]
MHRFLISCAIAAAAAVVALAQPRAASAASLQDFGRCLARQGATFYGASWCPHCQSQREMLGDAMSSVRYVECSVDGGRGGTAPACSSAGVDSYPTWVFGDGTRASGAQSLGRLAAKTGCALPSEGKTKPADRAAVPRRGPKIMEVPQQ